MSKFSRFTHLAYLRSLWVTHKSVQSKKEGNYTQLEHFEEFGNANTPLFSPFPSFFQFNI